MYSVWQCKHSMFKKEVFDMYSVWQCIHSVFRMEASVIKVSGNAYTVCSKKRLRYVKCLAVHSQCVRNGGFNM